ncbi:uncharacterized protein LOC142575638 [Dermacentor variabilis]|uniref:uncharacterized protein LOC142575638 n=1 Tax=Dermacentor variabilis TaxID=34621 RepID=UPI003F5B018A
MGTVCIDVDLDMKPMSLDLVFPEGIERGGRINFNFSRARFDSEDRSDARGDGVTQWRPFAETFFDAAYAREKVRVSSGGRPSSFCYIDGRHEPNEVFDDAEVVEIQTQGCEIEVESELPSPAASPIPDPCSPESASSPEPAAVVGNHPIADTVDAGGCARSTVDEVDLTGDSNDADEKTADAATEDHTYMVGQTSTVTSAVGSNDDTATRLVISNSTVASPVNTTVIAKDLNIAENVTLKPDTVGNSSANAAVTAKKNTGTKAMALYSCLYCRHITPCKETAIAHCKLHTSRKDPLPQQTLIGAASVKAGKVVGPTSPDKAKPQRNNTKPRIGNVFSLTNDKLSVITTAASASNLTGDETTLGVKGSIETTVLPTVLNMLASVSPNVKRVVLKTGPVPLSAAGSLTPKNITAVVKRAIESNITELKSVSSSFTPKPLTTTPGKGLKPIVLPKSLVESKNPITKPPPNTKIVFKCFKCSHVTFDKLVALKHLQEHTTAAQEKQMDKESHLSDESEGTSAPGTPPVPGGPEALKKRSLPLTGSQLKPLVQQVGRLSKAATESIKYFACTKCRKVYKNKASLNKHMVKHTGEQKFRCEICDRRFQFKSVLQVHMKVHNRVTPYKCTKCKRSFTTEAALKNHEEKSHSDPVICHLCNLPFVRQHNLVVHMMQRHGQTAQHRCTSCRKPFFTEEDLAAHKNLCKGDIYRHCGLCSFKGAIYKELCEHVVQCHPEVPQFKCETCGLVSIHKVRHRGHVRTHQPGYKPTKVKHTYKCPQCGKEMRSQSGLQSHLSSHNNIRPFACPTCGCSFSSKGSLRAHRLNVHASTTYSCEQCPLTCKSLFALRKHKTLIHGQTINFQCDHCNKRFTCERKKQLHTAVVHMGDTACLEDGQNPFPTLKVYRCTETDCTFATFSLYRSKAHAITHTGVMPFQCTQCDKAFVVQDELKRHITLQHNKGKQKPCPHCGRVFVSDSRYEWHLRLHENNQGFKCTKCSYLYESKAYLEHHQQKHAEENLSICQVCNKTFKTVRAMGIHVTHMHPEVAKSPSLQVLRSLRYPHGCDQCPVRFKTTTELRAHKLCRHSGGAGKRVANAERNFECHFCGKAFKHNCALQTHLRTHTGERPFECPHCSKAFTIHQTLKDHIVSVHTKDFKLHCLLCGKGVVNNTKLKQHLQHAHKAVPKPTLPLSARTKAGVDKPKAPRAPAKRAEQPQLQQHLQPHQLHLAPIVFVEEQNPEIGEVYVEQEVVTATETAMVVEDPIKLLTSFF